MMWPKWQLQLVWKRVMVPGWLGGGARGLEVRSVKTLFSTRNLLLRSSGFILITLLLVCDLATWSQLAPSNTTLSNHNQMDLLKKVDDMKLLFFNIRFFIINKIFHILNFWNLGAACESFWRYHACSDKFTLVTFNLKKHMLKKRTL